MARINNRIVRWGVFGSVAGGSTWSRSAWIEGFIIGVMVGGALFYGLIKMWGG